MGKFIYDGTVKVDFDDSLPRTPETEIIFAVQFVVATQASITAPAIAVEGQCCLSH